MKIDVVKVCAGLIIIFALLMCSSVATETTWRLSGFELWGYDINCTDHNLSNVKNIDAENITSKKIGGVIYADQYATIQDAINAAAASSTSKTVYVKYGTYTESLTIPNGVWLKGAGMGFYGTGTTITCNNASIITMDTISEGGVENIRLYGTNYNNTLMVGLNLTKLDKNVVFENVYINNVHTGIILNGSYTNTFKTIRIGGTGTTLVNTGWKMVDDSTLINAPVLHDIVIGDTFGDGMYAESMNGVYATSLQIINAGGHCLNISGSAHHTSGPNTFLGIAVDNCELDGIHINKVSASDSSYMQFIAPWVTHCQNGIYLDDSYAIQIIAPIIEYNYKNGIVLNFSHRNQIVGGTVSGWDANTTNTYYGIVLQNGSKENIISSMDLTNVGGLGCINENGAWTNQFTAIGYDVIYSNLHASSTFSGQNKTSSQCVSISSVGYNSYHTVNGATNFGKLATAPTSPMSGNEYYNTTDNKKYCYDGSAWFALY